jgi:hypothetical protein
MKFSRLELGVVNDSSVSGLNTWKDRVKQEKNSYFEYFIVSSVGQGLKSQKILPTSFGQILRPSLNTIRTNSYINVDNEYEQMMIEKGEFQEEETNKPKRHRNYPWSLSKIQLEHDCTRKSVYSPKYLHMKKLRKQEIDRQNNASKSLFSGLSTTRLLAGKLPPITRRLPKP